MQVHRDDELHAHATTAAMLNGIVDAVEDQHQHHQQQQASHGYGFEATASASWAVNAPYDVTTGITDDNDDNNSSSDVITTDVTPATSSFAFNGHDDNTEDDDDEAMVDSDSGFACTQVIDEGSDAEEDATGESASIDDHILDDDDDDDEEEEADEAAPVALKEAALSPRKVASPSPKTASPAPAKTSAAPVTQQNSSSTAAPASNAPEAPAVTEDTSALGKFSSVLGTVWPMLEATGWQEARGGDALFCSMPGTQFFNFRPNVNVFDSREKACWKYIATAAAGPDVSPSNPVAATDAALWDLLWDVAATHFGWFTMQCGPETWFVKPETRFEAFEPNVTIFQTKKRAVIKCLEVEDVVVDLGDSVDGRQVLTFGQKKKPAPAPKKAPFVGTTMEVHSVYGNTSSTTTSSSKTSAKKKLKDVFTTPSPTIKRKDKRSASSATKASPSPASTAAATSSASKSRTKATPPKSSSSGTKKALTVTAMKQKLAAHRAKKASATRQRNKSKAAAAAAPTGPVFYVPEFKCTFGMVYQKLQEIGWYHRPGKFEYDYFAPTYTPETAVLNRNYFQSVAEFEEFLKDSGAWEQIEREFRDVHDDEVALLRADAIAKHEARKKKVEAREKTLAIAKAQQKDAAASAKAAAQAAKAAAREEATRAKQEQRLMTALSLAARVATAPTPTNSSSSSNGGTMRRPSGFATDLQNEFKVSMGKVVKKLLARGWSYRPGRFEYDYFKPGVTIKTARLNEDYFQSEADLETYLKISGLWDEIARELLEEHNAEQEREAMLMSQEEANAKLMKRPASSPMAHDAVKKLRAESPTAAASVAPAATVSSSSYETAEHRSVVTTSSSVINTSNSRAVAMSNLMSPSKSPVPAPTASRVAHIAADEVEELTNDIWANSHHFEFERR